MDVFFLEGVWKIMIQEATIKSHQNNFKLVIVQWIGLSCNLLLAVFTQVMYYVSVFFSQSKADQVWLFLRPCLVWYDQYGG